MRKSLAFWLSIALALPLLWAAAPLSVTAQEEVLDPHVECSVRDSAETGLGLAFQFRMKVTGAASPINCYLFERGGDYVNNYYLDTVTHTSRNEIPGCDETALSRADMIRNLAAYLNAGRAEAARWAGVDADAICLWVARSDHYPMPAAKP